jgi:lipid A ethanolaminephosphotransferase
MGAMIASLFWSGTRARLDLPSRRRVEIHAPAEAVILVAALFWTLCANAMFLRAVLHNQAPAGAGAWGLLLALGVALTALQFFFVALVATRRTVKPLLATLTLAAALASHFMQAYGVYLDPGMLRNVLASHVGEARELLGPRLVLHLLVFAGLPLLALWRVRIAVRPWRRALVWRLGALAVAALVCILALLAVFQPAASLMRNHKEVRYLATPANLVWSAAKVAISGARGARRPREAIGLDARPGPAWAQRKRPLVVVLVVGETARAANWGLGGYARQTTPELARLPVVNFAQTTSCGTSTEASLPCMFAPVGRRDYDEARIRRQESLLHVVSRAGVAVRWRDNQSGCKGVCDGLPTETVSAVDAPGLCRGDDCLDEGLLAGIDARLAGARGTQLWVLHQLGNHGPAYARRYPPAYARFQPACASDDLGRCSREEIVNAYDNALLYTDHLLATLIGKLQAHAGEMDVAMLYVSDHGESLGEAGLYLHGMPYPIAPVQQTHVPMVLWMGERLAADTGVGRDCLTARAQQPASHDNLFHTLLGLLDVRSSLYDAAWDLGAACRAGT